MEDVTPDSEPKQYKPWQFTPEKAREMQERSVIKRMQFSTPERRKYMARRAALRRWYKPNDDDLSRVEGILRVLAIQVADAMASEDNDRILRGVSTMLGWEKLKISLRAGNEKNVTPELSGEIEGKLAAARERREKALTAEAVDPPATK